MLQKEGGLVGERLLDQRRVVDLEMVGVVVACSAARRPARSQLNVFGIDESFAIADTHQ